MFVSISITHHVELYFHLYIFNVENLKLNIPAKITMKIFNVENFIFDNFK